MPRASGRRRPSASTGKAKEARLAPHRSPPGASDSLVPSAPHKLFLAISAWDRYSLVNCPLFSRAIYHHIHTVSFTTGTQAERENLPQRSFPWQKARPRTPALLRLKREAGQQPHEPGSQGAKMLAKMGLPTSGPGLDGTFAPRRRRPERRPDGPQASHPSGLHSYRPHALPKPVGLAMV